MSNSQCSIENEYMPANTVAVDSKQVVKTENSADKTCADYKQGYFDGIHDAVIGAYAVENAPSCTPRDFTHEALFKAWWTCDKCGGYTMSIRNRVGNVPHSCVSGLAYMHGKPAAWTKENI